MPNVIALATPIVALIATLCGPVPSLAADDSDPAQPTDRRIIGDDDRPTLVLQLRSHPAGQVVDLVRVMIPETQETRFHALGSNVIVCRATAEELQYIQALIAAIEEITPIRNERGPRPLRRPRRVRPAPPSPKATDSPSPNRPSRTESSTGKDGQQDRAKRERRARASIAVGSVVAFLRTQVPELFDLERIRAMEFSAGNAKDVVAHFDLQVSDFDAFKAMEDALVRASVFDFSSRTTRNREGLRVRFSLRARKDTALPTPPSDTPEAPRSPDDLLGFLELEAIDHWTRDSQDGEREIGLQGRTGSVGKLLDRLSRPTMPGLELRKVQLVLRGETWQVELDAIARAQSGSDARSSRKSRPPEAESFAVASVISTLRSQVPELFDLDRLRGMEFHGGNAKNAAAYFDLWVSDVAAFSAIEDALSRAALFDFSSRCLPQKDGLRANFTLTRLRDFALPERKGNVTLSPDDLPDLFETQSIHRMRRDGANREERLKIEGVTEEIEPLLEQLSIPTTPGFRLDKVEFNLRKGTWRVEVEAEAETHPASSTGTR